MSILNTFLARRNWCGFVLWVMCTCLGEPGAGGEVDTWQGCVFSGCLYVEMVSLRAATSFFLEPNLGLFGALRQHIISQDLGITH